MMLTTCPPSDSSLCSSYSSLIHTLASFVLLSYSRFIIVSFMLMTITPLVKQNGKGFGLVAFYDGTITLFSPRHAFYVLLSLPALIVFAIITPLLLIVPSLVRNLTVIRNRWPKLGKYLPNCDRFSVTPWPRLTTFLEAFHGCYRDGTNSTKNATDFDFRWFAGFYLMLRITLFGVHAFANDWLEQYTSQQFVCVVGLLAFLFLRPYKDDYYNKLDAGMFVLLLGINTLTMYNYGTTIIRSKISAAAFGIHYVLVLIPLIYISVIVTRHIYHRVRDKCAKSKRRRHAVITDPEQEELVSNGEGPMTQSGSHDYLSFMKETGRLKDVNTYQPSNSWSSRSEQNSNSSGSMHSVNSTSSPDNSRDDYE